MEILKIIMLSLGSLVTLFILAKVMGDREMSELSMFDYISSITIGSIAAEMATSLEENFVQPLIAMVVYAIISFLISYLTCKSMHLRRFFEGRTIILYQSGQVYEKNLLKAKIDVNEFLSMCRVSGYFDLEEIHTAYLEPNGKLSILPTTKHRPVTPNDLNLNPEQEYPLANVIIDGHIIKENLQAAGKDEKWIEKQLNAKGVKELKDVILATCDISKQQLNVYIKLNQKVLDDIFQ
ncbi:DUF421 domain-containing protein [Anaerocolumna cellulosilytica]|uniref:DUF421 domain-containing protein n=1 Tax=Anaerocolumna cellulosilytica TaxID=433286 RepID=A0A6S6R625_9FIRM|nr:DUF421 domain-containing protein [Anaerocolumna cellulosilytica]MBB5193884.1 uncharacterized membrane protein YcaP (DUF421 family) [Anaerocolumna cellulosilytica]BCJ94900.1 DUF421 domain-containing protein [Anaerocolumna cellulosilytica]